MVGSIESGQKPISELLGKLMEITEQTLEDNTNTRWDSVFFDFLLGGSCDLHYTPRRSNRLEKQRGERSQWLGTKILTILYRNPLNRSSCSSVKGLIML